MLNLETAQLDLNSQILEKMVQANHPYRRVKEIINFEELLKPHCKARAKNCFYAFFFIL